MVELTKIKRGWNRLLNRMLPNRRQRILAKMMREDAEVGLYDDACCGNWTENGECTCVNFNQHGESTETTK
jgi:hypothetical protein